MENHTQFTPPQLETFNPVDTVFGQTANSATEIATEKAWRVKNTIFANDTDFNQRKGQIVARTAVSGNYSVAVFDYIVAITSLATAPTIGLPKPSSILPGKIYVVKDEVGGAATTTITIRSEGDKNIDGTSTSTLTTNYQARSYYTDGINWFTY